jgi:UDP-N-acetylmuramoylalanine-D-glutamate ligase
MKDQPGLEGSGIGVETGEHYLEHLNQFDVIFKSAGVPYSNELKPFEDKILTQVQFFFNNYK